MIAQKVRNQSLFNYKIIKLIKNSVAVLQSTPLQNITDLNVLSKVLPGIAAPNLATIPHGLKVNTLVNLLSASLSLGIDITSYQVSKFISTKHF